MGGILGGGAKAKGTMTVTPLAATLHLQSSAYGQAIPIVYGLNRIAGNIIWYSDFRAVSIFTATDSSASGGKGGGHGSTSWTVDWDYYAAVMIAICEGPIYGIYKTWRNKSIHDWTTGDSQFLFAALGTYPTQTVFSWLSGAYPASAIGFQGTALVADHSMLLGRNNPSIDNFSFEVAGSLSQGGDVWPHDIFADLATNTHYGAGLVMGQLYDLTEFATYCIANSLLMSPIYDSPRSASEIIDELLLVTNCVSFQSGGQLRIRPYGYDVASAYGYTYNPNLTPLYDLDENDFMPVDGDPVLVIRGAVSDAYNNIKIECTNRAQQYAPQVVEVKDQASIDQFGLRVKDTISFRGFCDPNAAYRSASLMLQRFCNVRNTFRFRLSARYPMLEPMDLVTLTEPGVGLDRTLVRLLEIEESDDGHFDITAEEMIVGGALPASYVSQEAVGYSLDLNFPPGPTAAPVFFEPLIELSPQTGLEVWVAISGTRPWGGCNVWVSLDGATFERRDKIVGGARYGELLTYMGPEVGAVARVRMYGAGGNLLSGSIDDAINLRTLIWIDGEFIAYTAVNLVDTNTYDVYCQIRGVNKSPVTEHAAGSRWARIDQASLAKSGPLAAGWIGKNLHFKFTAFNYFQGAEQTLDSVPIYTYTVTGNMLRIPPPDVTGLRYVHEAYGVRLIWDLLTTPDVVSGGGYILRQGGNTWEDAVPLLPTGGETVTGANSFFWDITGVGTRRVWVKAYDSIGNQSVNAALVDGVTELPGQANVNAEIVGADFVLSWTLVTGSFAIDHYELRFALSGALWEDVALLPPIVVYSSVYRAPVFWGSVMSWYVVSVDIAGNASFPSIVNIPITSPNSVTITRTVIDNNVLLKWTDATRTLPIKNYEVRKGDAFNSSALIGYADSTFSVVFEEVSGEYVYWVRGIDTANNAGPPASVMAVVNQPPDYVLFDDIDVNLSKMTTSSNAYENPRTPGKLLCPVNLTETTADHYATPGFDTPQEQVDAGFPIVIEKVPTSGYIEYDIDYGTAITATISTVLYYDVLDGTPTLTPKISVKTLAGDPWTNYDDQDTVLAAATRYVRVRWTVSGSGNNDLIRINRWNIHAGVKAVRDSGMGTANAADSDGTQVNFTKSFYDVRKITVSAAGTAARYAIYNFVDVPNPTGMKVLIFDNAGTRVSGNFSWDVEGV